MLASDLIETLAAAYVKSISLSNVGDMSPTAKVKPNDEQVANQKRLLAMLNQGNLELHKRYQLLVNTVDIDFPEDGETYEIPADFIAIRRAYYPDDPNTGIALRDPFTDRDNTGIDRSVSLMMSNSREWLIKGSDIKNRMLIKVEYVAAPKKVRSITGRFHINNVFENALLQYATYMALSSIGNQITEEIANRALQRYESACRRLEKDGYGNTYRPKSMIFKNSGMP